MTIYKSNLRKEYLQKRLSLSDADAQQHALSYSQHLLHYLPATPPCVIAGYSTMRGEIDVMPALQQLAQKGHRLCLPVIAETNSPLVFHSWKPGDALVAGTHNTLAPVAHAPVVTPDIIIVPLLAFDRKGYRLGYGGGYYDRTLQALRAAQSIQAIGAAYSLQQTDTLPIQSHDATLDAVITENGVIQFT
ncbi:MAG: 5-formyltetrahydrofolate cyclo-ligase [Rickettsiales bacterium]|nr:5-formyltetrahydrofolate cyclo-ligase [Rickettsiales bacterium]